MTAAKKRRMIVRACAAMALIVALNIIPSHAPAQEMEDPDLESFDAGLLVPAIRTRALLLGFDQFVTQEKTTPASWNNVDGMASVLSGMMDLGDLWTRRDDISDHAALERVIDSAFRGATDYDISYFYISTHGLYQRHQPAEEMGMLLTDGVRDTILTAGQLRQMLDRIPGRKILMIDCCHAGAMIGKGVEQQIGNAFTGGDYQVLCSSGGAEDSWFWAGNEGETTGAGFFTGTLIRGISGRGGYGADANRNGRITLGEVRDYLRQHHGASTVHLYPSDGAEELLMYNREAYNPRAAQAEVTNVAFEDGMLSGHNPLIHFSFTVTRPIQVAYQLVYQRDGKWDFPNSTLMWDDGEHSGAFGDAVGYMSPGYKEREVILKQPEEGDYGYVLLQILTYRDGQPALISSRVFAVTPEDANPQLEMNVPSTHDMEEGEMALFIGHIYPCELSVTVEDEAAHPVRRLMNLTPSRPENLRPMGTSHTWDGLDDQGRPVPEGHYRLRVKANLGGKTYEKLSNPFLLIPMTVPQG